MRSHNLPQTKEEIDTKAFERQRRVNNPFSLEGAVMTVNPMWQKATAAQAAAHIPQARLCSLFVSQSFGSRRMAWSEMPNRIISPPQRAEYCKHRRSTFQSIHTHTRHFYFLVEN
jgi:hypothetical protein